MLMFTKQCFSSISINLLFTFLMDFLQVILELFEHETVNPIRDFKVSFMAVTAALCRKISSMGKQSISETVSFPILETDSLFARRAIQPARNMS